MDNFASAEFQKALAEEMCLAFDGGPEKRSALAKKITQKLQNEVDQRDLSGMLLDKEFIPLGTQVEWTLDTPMRVYWHEPGSYAPRTAIYQKVFTLTTEMLSVHPEYEINQLRAGRYGTVAYQAQKARDAVLGAINAKIWNTFVGSIASGSVNYANASGGLTKAALDRAITWTSDQPGGGPRAIVARRPLLDTILDFGTAATPGDTGVFDDATKRQVLTTGAMGSYRGVPLVPLPQWIDANGMNTISGSDVMVVGGGSGKYVVQTDLQSMDEIEVDTLMWHMHIWTRVGVAVFFPLRNYRINVV